MISNRVVFNMQRSIQSLLTMQGRLSSGRRIELPSDDPVGTLRDLDYRSELAKNDQYLKNISQGRSWLQNYDTTMAELKNLVSTSKELAIAMSNGTYDDQARQASASEIRSIYEQIVQLGNGTLEGKRIFSGFRTDTQALTASEGGAVYHGDTGQIEFQIETASRVTVNFNGADVFLRRLTEVGSEADLNVAVTGSTLLADLNAGSGIDQATGTFTIIDHNLNISSTVDVTGAVTVDDVLNAINAQLAADGITNLSAEIAPEGNGIRMNIDDTLPNQISVDTPLDNLNGGRGVDFNDGRIHLTDGIGIDVDIDLGGASTVGDVITEFNTQMAAAGPPLSNVTMQLNAAGTGLEINDANGAPLGLSIGEVDAFSSTAQDLGIMGDIDASMTGLDLNPQYSFEIEETAGTTAADLVLVGEFIGDWSGGDMDPLLTATSNVVDFNNGSGYAGGEIVIWQGLDSRTIDLSDPAIVTVQDLLDLFNNAGLDITAAVNADNTGIQISNNDPTRSLTVEDVGDGRLAKDMGIFGSTDMMGSLQVLIHCLDNNDQEGTGMLLENLDASIQHLLNIRSTVGATASRLETTQARLTDMGLNFTKLLSEVEDADLTKLMTDLAMMENSYQASLLAGARIMQPSLMDFLR
jgi:flagellar hook-associated protein 3